MMAERVWTSAKCQNQTIRQRECLVRFVPKSQHSALQQIIGSLGQMLADFC
jgi:hypothetical protein